MFQSLLCKLLKRSGGRGRDRTYDQSIKSRMLYQLSYASFLVLLLEEEVDESPWNDAKQATDCNRSTS